MDTFHGLFVVDIMPLGSASPCSCCSCSESASVLLGHDSGGGVAASVGSLLWERSFMRVRVFVTGCYVHLLSCAFDSCVDLARYEC